MKFIVDFQSDERAWFRRSKTDSEYKIYFSLFGWWTGVGFKWKTCNCCGKKSYDRSNGCAGIKYFNLGYFTVNVKEK